MSHVCNHGTDQSDRRTNVARFCDITCSLDLWTGTCSASTESADSSHAILLISTLGLIFALSHGWSLREGFCLFFQVQNVSLRVLFFFEVYLFESSFGSMMINTIFPGSQGSLAAVADRDLAILPWLPKDRECIFTTCVRRGEYFRSTSDIVEQGAKLDLIIRIQRVPTRTVAPNEVWRILAITSRLALALSIMAQVGLVGPWAMIDNARASLEDHRLLLKSSTPHSGQLFLLALFGY